MNNPTDTNQASELHELCKKVYELTEWECGGEYVYHHNDLVDIVQGKPAGDHWENNWWFPLYTSDYLLGKLKHTADEHAGDQLQIFTDTKGWSAKMTFSHTDEDERYHFHETSNGYGHDTPLKALLKLTIALSEAGELK